MAFNDCKIISFSFTQISIYVPTSRRRLSPCHSTHGHTSSPCPGRSHTRHWLCYRPLVDHCSRGQADVASRLSKNYWITIEKYKLIPKREIDETIEAMKRIDSYNDTLIVINNNMLGRMSVDHLDVDHHDKFEKGTRRMCDLTVTHALSPLRASSGT